MIILSLNEVTGKDGKFGYIPWASRAAGIDLALPSEAQFECAGRVGMMGCTRGDLRSICPRCGV